MLFVLTYVPLWQQLSFIRITSNFVNIVFFSLKYPFPACFFGLRRSESSLSILQTSDSKHDTRMLILYEKKSYQHYEIRLPLPCFALLCGVLCLCGSYLSAVLWSLPSCIFSPFLPFSHFSHSRFSLTLSFFTIGLFLHATAVPEGYLHLLM